MKRLSSFLRIPQWLERAWQDTRIAEEESAPPPGDPREADTVPLPLHGTPVDRR